MTLEDLDKEPLSEEEAAALRHRAVLNRELEEQRVKREARRILDLEARPTVREPEILTLRERLARPRVPVAYRIDGWQPAGTRIILAAQNKAGKTTLTGNLARCLVDGDLWLGQYKVDPLSGRLVILDFEMGERQLDQWFEDQGITNDDRVVPIPMRGKVSAFDLLDSDRLDWWANKLRGLDCEYLIWDCLRPVMDGLGLSENQDAGKILVAFDDLLASAGVPDAGLVHHMGHNFERSRGDSRLRDWPDVEWRLVREDPDDPGSPRYLSAYGRDVDVSEAQLSYDAGTRHLTVIGGSRKTAAERGALIDVLTLLAAEPRLSGRAIEDKITTTTDHTRAIVRSAVKLGIQEKVITTEAGPRRSVLHSQCASAPECAASAPARSSECASAPIGGALHSDAQEGLSAPLLCSTCSQVPPDHAADCAWRPLDLCDQDCGTVLKTGETGTCGFCLQDQSLRKDTRP